MFASLSSFLPAALQQLQSPRPDPDPDASSLPEQLPVVPPIDPPRRRERRERHANEAFIIVRPPPSKSGQPLSLQVQLVPPQSRHDRPLQALDSSPDRLSTDLERTHSHRSETSDHSAFTSTGSFSSLASTSTASSGGRRMIIPLYNLNVHSVMATTVLDAGTDAKVAKFAKRGIEVIGLAFLEPIEVRPPAPANGSLAPSASLHPSFDEFGTPAALSPPHRPPTADRPHHTPVHPSRELPLAPPLPPPDAHPQRPTKKLFSKVFRRKDGTSPLPVPVPLPDAAPSPQPPPFHDTARRNGENTVSLLDTPHHYDAWHSTPLTSTTASHAAVLGVHATLFPPVPNPTGRPTKYIWVVRKWLKGTDSGVLNGVMGKFSVGARDTASSTAPFLEVRFEWSKGLKKAVGRRKTRADKSFNSREDRSSSRHRTPGIPLPRLTAQSLTAAAHDHRSSVISHASSSSDSPASLGSSSHPHHEQSDEESDPEDSETPWTCTVVVQCLGQLPYHSDALREPVVRLKAATLTPTPHHPKVVSLLKMPFPLPDIELERLAIRPRLVTPQGIRPTRSDTSGFVLTAEEIKDTVSCTALWLVFREAFGGVGRERKKGKS